MKRTLLVILLIAVVIPAMAGGIVHNSNQSASFIRMPARDASLGLDAVYYNPAGLVWLNDGFHLSLNNQYVTQTRTIGTTYPGLNRSEFTGEVVAPFFPSFYAVYKKDRLAFSLGFNPIGGGGSAKFADGLPSFEMQVAGLPALLSASGIPTSSYSFDTEFEGKSVFYGIQGGVSYKINDIVSVSAGLRYVMMNNHYQGYLKNIQINPAFPILGFTGSMVPAPNFFNAMAGMFQGLAGIAGSLEPLVAGGGGSLTLAQAQQAGYLTSEDVASIAGGFALINPTIDPMTLSVEQIQGAYAVATPVFVAQNQAMAGYAGATADKEVDATQKGSGIVPMIGVNLNFERFNIGLKYEHMVSVRLKNDTKVDDVGLYPDGDEVPSDMPAVLSAGIGFDATSKFKVSAGVHYYFDKSAEYGKKLNNEFVKNDQVIDKNFWEFALGLEYGITENLMVSAGYLRTQTGVMDIYQTDLNHSLSTNSIAAGLRYAVNEKIGINLGAMNTFYQEDKRTFPGTTQVPSYTETYNRKAFTVALGVDLSF